MSVAFRLTRFRKIATALTAAGGGSAYLLRDHIRAYFSDDPKLQPTEISQSHRNAPKIIEDLPEQIPYLLVGGGTASHSAMRAIRGHDPKAKVLIVSSENHTPYMRPALSKDLWYSDRELRRELNFKWWNGKERSIYYELDEFYLPLDKMTTRENGGVSLVKNIKLTRLDPENKTAYLETGQSIKYEKCLLAPGGKPRSLAQFKSAPDEIKGRIIYFKTADDFLRLEKISETAKRILIVGGGFLGSELACALSNRGPDEKVPKDQVIYQVYPEPGNLGKVLPNFLSEYVSEKIKNEGANLIPNAEVKKVSLASDKSITVELSNGQTLNTDYIVCAVGHEPDVELAKSSGLEVDQNTGGYLVNSELEARTNVWVAGDASCFYDIKLGRRRVEHHDHAIHSGKLAGQNMIGNNKAYTHQSMFWSDLGSDISFEAVGIIDSNLQTVAVFADPNEPPTTTDSKQPLDSTDEKQPEVDASDLDVRTSSDQRKRAQGDKFGKGVVFYLKDGVVVGVLLWNLFSRLRIARRLLNEQAKYDDFNEVAKLFNIYLDD